jgi:hypothetical protein
MINYCDMPTWRLITSKKLVVPGKKYIYFFLSDIFSIKNRLFFTCSLDRLCPGQRPKGLCSDYNPGSIRLRGRITMGSKRQALQKRLTVGTQAIFIGMLNKGRL